MTSQDPITALSVLEAKFEKVVSDFNIIMGGKKIRPKKAAASAAHQAVVDILKRLETHHAGQAQLLTEVNAALMDIRWGDPLNVKPDSKPFPLVEHAASTTTKMRAHQYV